MRVNSFRKSEFSKTCLVAMLTAFSFAAASFFVAFYLPKDEPVEEIALPEEIEPEEEISPFFEDVNMLAAYETRDETLSLYRDPASRKAVEWFYASVVGSKDVANAILTEANKNDISPSLAFALAYVESRYNTHAKNTNRNKTIDRGLFQLNSASFPNLTEAEFFDPSVSAKYGMSHLRFCLDTAGNEISALAMYNAGTSKVRANNTPQITLNYIGQIISCQDSIDRLFADKILAYYETTPLVKDAQVIALAR